MMVENIADAKIFISRPGKLYILKGRGADMGKVSKRKPARKAVARPAGLKAKRDKGKSIFHYLMGK